MEERQQGGYAWAPEGGRKTRHTGEAANPITHTLFLLLLGTVSEDEAGHAVPTIV